MLHQPSNIHGVVVSGSSLYARFCLLRLLPLGHHYSVECATSPFVIEGKVVMYTQYAVILTSFLFLF